MPSNIHAPDVRDVTVTKRPFVRSEMIELGRGKVIRLEKSSQFKSIEVKHGLVWLTGTPAARDVILIEGEHFELRDCWPFVIEALERAEILFT